MEKPMVEKLREFTNGFEHYTFKTSVAYASRHDNLDGLMETIDENMTIAERDWDTRQVWDFDENNDVLIGTVREYSEKEDVPRVDAFCKIIIPDSWK